MPITKELSNIRKLEAAGFPHEQAEVLTDIIEQSHVDGQQSLKDFISRMHEDTNRQFDEINKKFDDVNKRFDDVNNRFDGVNKQFDGFRKEMHTEMTTLEWRIKASHSDLLMKIFAIVAGCTSIAVAVAKIL
ncbi:MAG: hypothetical protein A2W17_07390 [Planctomycetes bacterium RBG_16_41_13]|nr:MAG: hypothetical protein A2W17_07390 [Planctomycetes bacterium RBG_16_41_13]